MGFISLKDNTIIGKLQHREDIILDNLLLNFKAKKIYLTLSPLNQQENSKSILNCLVSCMNRQ